MHADGMRLNEQSGPVLGQAASFGCADEERRRKPGLAPPAGDPPSSACIGEHLASSA